MAGGDLAPDSGHNDPFATPSRLSDDAPQNPARSENDNADSSAPASTSRAMNTMEVQADAAASTPGQKLPLRQRWRQADESAYMATFGRLSRVRGGAAGNEKAVPTNARRRRPRAWRCTIIVGALIALLIVIIAIVVPVAVVFGRKHAANSEDSASDPDSQPQAQNSNIVTLQQGQYQGTQLSNGITSFLGLQFAAPPIGSLRFADPQPPLNFSGVKAATQAAPNCHSLGKFKSSENEDCLYLNVYTPSNATAQSKLPVYVFIQGGGLQGVTGHFNGSSLIAASGYNMLTVIPSYRPNAFGFLASSELQKEGSLNVGLKDQRQALQWVQQNIAQFGGDPRHVVLGGQSAGAGSAVSQLAAYGGRNDSLFAAAALESQSIQPVRDVPSSQFQYDYIVGNTTCANSDDTLSCLRKLSVQDLVEAITNSPFPNGAGGDPVFPYNPVLDDDFITEYPINAFTNGHYVSVPMIFGDVTNEGTIFVPQDDISDRTDSENFLRNTFPRLNSTMLDTYNGYYDFDDTSADPPYWQHVANAYGETRYTCPGIQLSNLVLKNGNGSKVWNYRYDVLDRTAAAAGLGVDHGSELAAIWGGTYRGPVSYAAGGANQAAVPLMQAYWTSFIQHLDPSVARAPGAPDWRPWTAGNRLHITTNSSAMENVDGDQATRCKYLNSIAVDIGQ